MIGGCFFFFLLLLFLLCFVIIISYYYYYYYCLLLLLIFAAGCCVAASHRHDMLCRFLSCRAVSLVVPRRTVSFRRFPCRAVCRVVSCRPPLPVALIFVVVPFVATVSRRLLSCRAVSCPAACCRAVPLVVCDRARTWCSRVRGVCSCSWCVVVI